MVGIFIAVFLTAAAVAFASHETQLMGVTGETLDLEQSSRSAIELLSFDLRQAGAGVGYDNSGQFQGLRLGPFTVEGSAGTVNFNDGASNVIQLSEGAPLDGTLVQTYALASQDLGIDVAEGAYASVVAHTGTGQAAGTGAVCFRQGTVFLEGERALLRSESGFAAQSVILTGINQGACPAGVGTANPCPVENQCTSFAWARDGFYDSGGATGGARGSAQNVGYLGGQLQGSFRSLVWFVSQGAFSGELRRGTFDGTNGCPPGGRTAACGALVADNVETLQVAVWAFDPAAANWVRVAPGAAVAPVGGRVPQSLRNARIRVDVEMVVRSPGDSGRPHPAIPLDLVPGATRQCVPNTSDCPAAGIAAPNVDNVERRVYRSSVELKNSGRFQGATT